MRSILLHSLFYIVSSYFLASGNLLFHDAEAAGDLPSQKARFEGMGSTFKAKKNNVSSANSSINTENSSSDNNETSDKNNTDDDSATYFKLHTFVVNVVDKHEEDKLLFLTLEVFCKINQAEDRWLIDDHLAPIKDTIISYVSGFNRQKIQTQKQKKELQYELTLRVAQVLKELTGKRVISGLYLTQIIIQ